MKPKKLNRMLIIDFIKSIQGIKHSFQEAILSNNIYLIGNDRFDPEFQVEFIPASKKYFFTIYVKGIKSEADNMHDEIYNFIQKLELDRNICLSTENQTSLINYKMKTNPLHFKFRF